MAKNLKGKGGKPTANKRGKGSNGGKSRNTPPVRNNAVNNKEIIIGKIHGNSRGFGFLVAEGYDDLFISPKALHGAMHGDTVKARKVSSNRGAGEAEVMEIIERGATRVVGTVKLNQDYGFIIPDDQRFSKDIFVRADNLLNAQSGEKVVAEIIDYESGNNPEGKVVEVLGYIQDKGVDVLSIIRNLNLYEEFPKAVLKDAECAPTVVKAEEIGHREDFRSQITITIDGEDSKDFDDAVSITRRGSNYVLSVHIADVAHYVKANSPMDKEAYKRGTSVYLCDRVLPMLPRELSKGICSLNEGVDRLTLSCIMEVDGGGNVSDYRIVEGVIKSSARMTYNQVASILDGDEELNNKFAPIIPMLKDMKNLSEILTAKRLKRGAVEFDLAECRIVIDENGKVTDVYKYPRLISHRIIEEFMLLANETVAEHTVKRAIPSIYRVHATPMEEKLENLNNFLSALGITFKPHEPPLPKDFADLLDNIDAKYATVINRVALRAMTKADYQPQCLGHFGLAAKYYCHFTSPIRRYPDLIVHRLIKEFMSGGEARVKKYTDFIVEASKNSSIRERLAEEAERKVDDLKKAEFMSDKIGLVYDGVVSGVTEWGIFVELPNTVEGMIRVEDLPFDAYVYNAELLRLVGGSHSYGIGDELTVEVKSVVGDRINFDLKVKTLDEAGKDKNI